MTYRNAKPMDRSEAVSMLVALAGCIGELAGVLEATEMSAVNLILA